jgi:hypothetical protein
MNKCHICGNPNAQHSILLEEPLCDECIEWAKRHGLYPIQNRTTVEEQYREYLNSFPMNDPRD